MTYEDFLNQIKNAFNGNVENNVDNVDNTKEISDPLSDASTGQGVGEPAPDKPEIDKVDIEAVVRSELIKIIGDLKPEPPKTDPTLSGVMIPQPEDNRTSEDIISERLLSGMGIKTKK